MSIVATNMCRIVELPVHGGSSVDAVKPVLKDHTIGHENVVSYNW